MLHAYLVGEKNEMEKRTKGKKGEQVKKKRANKEKRKQVRKKVEKEKISCLAKNRHAFEKR